jgi:hypothetical protein
LFEGNDSEINFEWSNYWVVTNMFIEPGQVT